MELAPLVQQLLDRQDVIGLAVVLVLCGLAFAFRHTLPKLLLTPKPAAPEAKDDKVSSRFAEIDRRLQHLEAQFEHVPTRDELHSMELAVTRLDEKLSAVDRTASATGHAVARIESYLINLGSKS